MVLVSECVIRKVDNVGRVSIPKHLRAKYNCEEGAEIEFFTYTDEKGKTYICFAAAEKEDE